MKRIIFRAVLVALIVLVLEGGARLLEKGFSALPGPFRHKGPPYHVTFEPGSRVSNLGKVSIANEGGYFGTYYPPQRTPGTYRIVLLGDSMGFGWGVDPEKSFPVMFEAELNRRARASRERGADPPYARYELLNFSVPGYNTHLEYERYFAAAEQFSPDHVIVAYFPNDAAIDRYVPNVWRTCPVRWNRLDRAIGVAVEYSGFVRVVHDTWNYATTGYPGVITGHPHYVDPGFYGFQCAMYWLGELKKRLDASGVRLSIIQIPYLGGTNLSWDAERHVQEYLERWFGHYGYPTFSLYPIVRGRDPAEIMFAGDQHPNEIGHRLFMEYLSAHLGDLGIPLPPPAD